jgi:glycosyltransferase involved in cell wall biosynthesis
MRVSVFTPTHHARYLDDCYASLKAQSFPDWEWIVLLNGKATAWSPPQPDPRVRVERSNARARNVGAVKQEACAHATGDILVELDHDDRLMSNALIEIVDAFTSHPSASLVYSDFAQINEDGTANYDRFDQANGWEYAEESVDAQRYLRCHAMAPSPHNVGYIWYAPNHVRSFRRSLYEQVGGYDASLPILDDHDLMIKLFKAGDFVHIPKLLYLQRIHRRNTQSIPETNANIQEQTIELYLEHIEDLALSWAGREGLQSLSLRTATTIGEIDIDERFHVGEIDPRADRLTLADNSVGVLKAVDILQRVPNRAWFLNECHRVLVHGGLLLTDTPSTDGRGAFQDPSHVAFYNENSFMYLTRAELRPTIPELTARLQVSHLRTYYPSDVHEAIDIPYVKANLIAIKDGPRQGGPLFC